MGTQTDVAPHDAPEQNSKVQNVDSRVHEQEDDISDSDVSDTDDEGVTEAANQPIRKPGISHWPSKSPGGRLKPPSWFHIGNDEFSAKGRVSKRDGRLKLAVRESPGKNYLAKAFGSQLLHPLNQRHDAEEEAEAKKQQEDEEIDRILFSTSTTNSDTRPIPKLNIVVMVIGSRGDIQPFIRIARILQDEHGHRVRIATHPAFRDFVEEDCGLEFFSIGGDPSELMAFMVKNPGLMPSFETVKKGEIGRRREQMAEMFAGFWRSCIEASDGEPGRDPKDARPFVADCIISNPPVMIHVHCAERLGCPLHIMFTFPYSPTQAFPHPLANIQQENMDESYTNFISYPLVELMTWTGLGDLVNDCRVNLLGLDPVSTIWAPNQLYRQHVPFTYLWSPSLCEKPKDWGKEINIAGYVFLELASGYKPSQELSDFLAAGEPPVYIGFGSIVVDDPKQFTSLIFSAVKQAGVRAIVNKGWGKFGDEGNTPDYIFMIDNVPHDWLFPRCKAVVHHGGAGTTAIGLKCAKPTVIVPFFGDQPFWGQICAAAKAGAHECVPYKKLTAEKLAESIEQCFSEESQRNVQAIADGIEREGDGARKAVDFFHASLPLRGTYSIRASIMQSQTSAWRIKGSAFRLSPLAAELLVQGGKYSYKDLSLFRIYPWADFQGPGGPITGAGTAVWRTMVGVGTGVASTPMQIGKAVRTRSKSGKKKKRPDAEEVTRTESNAVDEAIDQPGRVGHRDPGSTDAATEGNWPDHSTQQPANPSPSQDKAAEEAQDRNDGESPDGTAAATTSMDVGRQAASSITKPLTVIAQAPMEILLGIGQGLHNLPRLYGDATVRESVRISGFKSGMHAAGSEFVHEGGDAVTGIFTQPYHGGKQGGAVGAASGIGKGIGGFFLKGGAAIITPLGLAMKGVEKEMTKSQTPIAKIRAARMEQGRLEVGELTPAERREAEATLDEGLRVMREVWKEADKIRRSGITGRWRAYREKKRWIEYGAMESVEMSRKVREARSKGIPFERFMAESRRGLK